MKQFDIIYSYDIKYKYNMMHLVIILTDVSTHFWGRCSHELMYLSRCYPKNDTDCTFDSMI